MKITFRAQDFCDAEDTINLAVYTVASEYWNRYGKHQYDMYKGYFNQYKRRKHLNPDEQSLFDDSKKVIIIYKELEKAFKELDKRSKDMNDFFDEETNKLVDVVMKHRGILWY